MVASDSGGRPRVLIVDDDPDARLLLGRQLGVRYELFTAADGAEGLRVLAENPAIEVILADMQMPVMDGATFLQRARTAAPDSVRILITGNLDFSTAVGCVNEAQVFRFLAKPCSRAALVSAVEAAVDHYRLVAAERVLLEQTLQGSIKILADVLALTNPVSFGRAMRIKQHVSRLVEQLGVKERWQIEVAAMLSQIGWITLPQETAEKLHEGQPLSESEAAMVERLPTVAEQLLAHIPRFEVVREIVASQRRPARPGDASALSAEERLVARGGEILRAASDFDLLVGQGLSPDRALQIMFGRQGQYDPSVLAAFASWLHVESAEEPVREMPLLAVNVGMVFVEDVRMQNGTLLVARGYEVTDSFVERVRNIAPGSVREPVHVTMPQKKEPAP